jgi:PAS domain S-box-containing protein
VAELEAVRSRLDAVLELAALMGAEDNAQSILVGFCEAAREIVASRFAGMMVVRRGGAEAESFVSSGLDERAVAAHGEHPLLTGLLRDAIAGGQPIRVGGTMRANPSLPVGHPAVVTAVAVPLPFRGPWQGAMYLGNRLVDGAYGDDDVAALTALAAQAASAWESARLVTDLRTAVEDAEESRARFRAVLERSPNAIVAVDRSGRIVYANPQLTETFGYTIDEVIGQSVERLLPDRFAVRHTDHRAAYAENPSSRAMGIGLDLAGRRKDGSEFPVEIGLSPVQTRDGLLTFATIVDITARKSMEAQLRQAQKMEVVGQLAGGIAHDFNNMLMAIAGYGELLQGSLAADDERRGYVDGIERAADRAATLTRQLLAFSRQQVMRPDIVDLNTVVVEVEPILRRLITEEIAVDLRLDPALPPVLADPNQLEQIIVNLAVNARDAMPGGGSLTIETRSEEIGPEYGPAHGADVPPGWYSVIAMVDTGDGMDAATRERIFEPFFTTKAPGKGTGLGLSTVYGIVKQSGGYVWVYSEPGLGSTFKIYLPQTTTTRQAAAAQSKTARRRRKRTGSILLVEDDSQVRELVETVLTTAGHTVLSAPGPEQALQLSAVHADKLDLLVTDVVMPGMSGPALVQRLRAAIGPFPVLFMSGYSGEAVARHGVLEPDTDLLEKPFTPAALLGRIGEILARHER